MILKVSLLDNNLTPSGIHGKMVWYQDNPDKMPEHLNDVTWDDGEVLCSEEYLACEVEICCGDLDSTYYTYVKAGMED